MKNLFILSFIFLAAVSCCSEKSAEAVNYPDAATFAAAVDGKQVELYTLTSKDGRFVQITNYGARLVSAVMPDRDGKMANVVLGFNDVASYQEAAERFLSPVVGRVANRIKDGRFEIDGVVYQTTLNNGTNALHGGYDNFAEKVWDVLEVTDNTLTMQYISPDMEGGFPGTLTSTIKYTLDDEAALKLEFGATTDKKTVVNMTAHPFFNLTGVEGSSVDDHIVMIAADSYIPVDSLLIPTGEYRPVEGTAFDLRKPQAIGLRNDEDDIQLTYGGGYDHSWAVNRSSEGELVHCAQVVEPTSGRTLSVYTTQPAIQFYGGNSFGGVDVGRDGKPFGRRSGFAMETQHMPDSPNQPNFPSVILEPGEKYSEVCIYKFGVDK